ncbi:hypothetical protein phytr_7660 [Candidatus Phycorickettsia trachydisci]|uniref:Uncharacterized protein n=1 Tax=Candidatus Phycorickettsia trachydisci TaxID=2115978 RepID=A0A2P1P8V6_9RICK|nr:hypothetical protein [Candidatus Phycorickettsia trachydisci]AVP87702.1 hypothetical protein phytr_7660 [Candidatus Phycorickettsia trachydisci]
MTNAFKKFIEDFKKDFNEQLNVSKNIRDEALESAVKDGSRKLWRGDRDPWKDLHEVQMSLIDTFEQDAWKRGEYKRDALGQNAAHMFIYLENGMRKLNLRVRRHFISGARALGKKFKEFGEWLGLVAQDFKDYFTEKGMQAIGSALEGINKLSQRFNDIAQGRAGSRQR